ncbi:MAG: MFS transporter [Euryarchaeota archaeon]|nr:MFS transporter [Euryarchaeota archaeon]
MFSKFSVDKIGRKKIISFGLFVYAVDMFLFGTATQLWHLYALRAVQGAASGVVWPAATVMAADIVKFEDRGKAMGLFSMMWDLGMAFGPVIGSGIKYFFSMTIGFYVCSVMAFFSTALIILRVKETVHPEKFEEEMSERKELTPHKTILIGLCVGGMTTTFALGMTMSFLPVYGKEILGIGEAIGIVFGVMGAVRLIIKPISGELSDVHGKRIFLLVGRALSSITTALIVLATGFYTLLVPIIFAALGTGMALPANNAMVTSIAYKETRGKVMGIFATWRSFGLLVGSLICGWVYDHVSPQTPFILCGLVGMIGVVVIFFTVHDVKEVE